MWKLSCWSIKSQKNRGYQHSFLAFCYFVFSSSISNLVLWILLLTGTSKDTNMFIMALQILKFFQRKRNKSYSKDPYFLCHKTIWNGIEFCQVQYLSMQRLSNHYNCKVCHKRTRVGDGNCQDSLYPQQDPQQTSMNFCSPTIQPTRQVYKRKRFYRGLWHHPVHHEHQSFLKRGTCISFGSPSDTDLHRFPRWVFALDENIMSI